MEEHEKPVNTLDKVFETEDSDILHALMDKLEDIIHDFVKMFSHKNEDDHYVEETSKVLGG